MSYPGVDVYVTTCVTTSPFAVTTASQGAHRLWRLHAHTRARPRSNGSIAWQVPFHFYDETGRRRSTSETFDDFEATVRWCELAEVVGVAEARRIREIQLGTAVGCMTLVEWLRKYTARLTGIEERT
ncbi:hypothetical protein AB0E01_23975, partial [Nocardia vinacea]|uniref:hypothetical protein n=1 Tax=Nocardia vinacea TaxID=96468 RepID=UPI00340F3845